MNKDGLTRIPSLADDADLEGTQIHSASKAPASSGGERPFLIVLAGGEFGQMYALKQPETIIGRSPKATICIEDAGVSRQHARLTVDGTEVHVEDLASANGTFVNDRALTSKHLLR